MIRFENAEIMGWESTVRGMRNPMNSWDKSDSCVACDNIPCSKCRYYADGHCTSHQPGTAIAVGPNDLSLMLRLAKAGSVEGKYRRMIVVYVDITAPLYWWKEFDTYKVGTVANSCSTMHTIHTKEFVPGDFSHEHLTKEDGGLWLWTKADGNAYMCSAHEFLRIVCDVLNFYREKYIETKEKSYWWQIIQLLPSSYNQSRTVMLNYEVLANIYQHRRNHKLDEWREFCKWIETLPYSEIITCNVTDKKEEQED